MVRSGRIWLILLLGLLPWGLLAASSLNINGELQTDNRLRTRDQSYLWNENNLLLKGQGGISNQYQFYAELRLRNFGFPHSQTLSDLQKKDRSAVAPWALEIRELYADLYSFLIPNLDLRIGKQIIKWGTADRFNPTSNLSPDDLEDIFDFGKYSGTNAIKAELYLGGLTITSVYVPIFTPAILPEGDLLKLFNSDIPIPSSVDYLDTEIELPSNTPKSSSQSGIRGSFMLMDFDLSLSYFRGRDDLPLPDSAFVNYGDQQSKATVRLIYPRMEVYGFDLSGSISDFGIWLELGYVKPEPVDLDLYVNISGYEMRSSSKIQDKTPYTRYVLGTDYTFSNGWYLNLQYIHGISYERGKDNLKDYFSLRLEQEFLDGRLKLAPLSGAFSFNRQESLKEHYSYLYAPELIYKPYDNTEITLGCYLIEGKGNSFIAQMKREDQVYLKLRVFF